MNKNNELAEKILNYSCRIDTGENVVIQMTGNKSTPLVLALVNKLNKLGSNTTIINIEPEITAELIKGITIDTAKTMAKRDLEIMEAADVCIMIKSIEDDSVMKDIPVDKMKVYSDYYTKHINKSILETTRWISLRYPNEAMANRAGMSIKEFKKYYFDVCNADYRALSKSMDELEKLMEKTNNVHIIGPDTDIKFSIKDIPVHKCDGIINLPDGEVYTAPIKNSINGHIRYNIASVYNGIEFNNVTFEFKDGRIISATCGDSDNLEALENILNMDDGARYIGEFALGVNPYVLHPTKDILFDEKIAGSFHLTPGFSYKDAFNGNESSVHWDLVCIQTEAYGGGKIYFDDVLIRENGMFMDEKLRILNPK